MPAEPTVNGPAAKLICQALGHDNVSHIAKAIGYNRTTLSLIFSGTRRGGLDLAMKLSGLTGQPAHVFFGPDDPKRALADAARAAGITAADLEAVS